MLKQDFLHRTKYIYVGVSTMNSNPNLKRHSLYYKILINLNTLLHEASNLLRLSCSCVVHILSNRQLTA
jgi:hypothetical protein